MKTYQRIYDFRTRSSKNYTPCLTSSGVEYGSVEKQKLHRTVSFQTAWDIALANSGRVDLFHIPTDNERIQSHQAVVREVQKKRHEEALNLLRI